MKSEYKVLLYILLMCGRVQIFGKRLNESKFNSRRNQEQTELRQCFLSFGAESFVFQFAVKNSNIKIHRIINLPAVFMGVKFGF
jgi:hypothetical protein